VNVVCAYAQLIVKLKCSVDIVDGSRVEIMDEFCYLRDTLSIDVEANAAVTRGFAVDDSSSGH